MANKKRIFQAIISAVLFMAVGVLIIAYAPSKVKALPNTATRTPFYQLNVGVDFPYYYFKSGYVNMSADYSYITYPYNDTYSYEIINLGSDVARIKTVFVYLLGQTGNTSTYFSNGDVIQCGFYSGAIADSNNSSNILNNVDLPYYVTKDSFLTTTSQYVGYIDVSMFDIQPEGNMYFICRYTNGYRSAYNVNIRPQFLFWDLDLNPNSADYFNAGVEAGKTEGYSLGYSAGIDVGYSRGYSAGADIGSEDYHIHDLLFTIFDTPFEVLHNLFSFTIFSTPVWTIIVSLLSLLVVLWLIKRLLT